MTTTNKIYLFEWPRTSPMGWLILLATQCPYVHAAIEVNGILYDASESRGTFDRADRERLKGRPCLVAEVQGDLSGWLRHMSQRQYDYRGVLGWLICRFLKRRCGDDQKFYCFEAANEALKALQLPYVHQRAVSGCDLRNVIPDFQYFRFGEQLG